MKTIAVLGTLDSKGEEHAYLADLIRVSVWSDHLARTKFLVCGTGDMSACEGDCSHRATSYSGVDWARCPFRMLNEHGPLSVVRLLRSQREAGMVVDSSDLVGRVSMLWLRLEHAHQARRKEESS